MDRARLTSSSSANCFTVSKVGSCCVSLLARRLDSTPASLWKVSAARCVPRAMQMVGAADARMTCPHVVESDWAVTPTAAEP
jgi:hypothetical protein